MKKKLFFILLGIQNACNGFNFVSQKCSYFFFFKIYGKKTTTRDENRGTHGELFKSIMNFNFTVDLSNNCHGILDQMEIKFSGDDL